MITFRALTTDTRERRGRCRTRLASILVVLSLAASGASCGAPHTQPGLIVSTSASPS